MMILVLGRRYGDIHIPFELFRRGEEKADKIVAKRRERGRKVKKSLFSRGGVVRKSAYHSNRLGVARNMAAELERSNLRSEASVKRERDRGPRSGPSTSKSRAQRATSTPAGPKGRR